MQRKGKWCGKWERQLPGRMAVAQLETISARCHSELGDSRARNLTRADAVDAIAGNAYASCSPALLASAQPMSGFRKVPAELGAILRD